MDEKIRKKIEEIRKKYGEVGLNLGCYDNIKEGCINLDKKKYFEGIDLVHDLEKFPYPFEDNIFEEILCYSVIEHIDVDRIRFYEELHRIGKDGCIMKIRVPFKDKIARHPEHKGQMFSFQHFRKLTTERRDYTTSKRFELIKLDHEPTQFAKFIPKRLRYILSHFINEIIENIIVEMKVIK